MILKKSDVSKTAMIFLVDKHDARNLLGALNNTKLYGHSDLRLTKVSESSAIENTLHIDLCEESEEFFYIKSGKLSILLSADSIEYAEYLLSSYIENEHFPLAEFIEIQTDKFKQISQLYFYKKSNCTPLVHTHQNRYC
jgi:hypothetical protein